MPADGGRIPAHWLDAAVELMGRAGRGGTVRVQGASMVPTLREGQVLAVEFAPADLRTGDLLLFRQAEMLVVHRLVGGGGRALRTRGDAVLGLDPPVARDRVVGRVVALQDGDVWRSVRGPAARRYARTLAWHDRFWAAAGGAARRAERGLARIGLRPRLALRVASIDRRLLRLAHRLLHRRLHPRVPRPPEAGAEGAGR